MSHPGEPSPIPGSARTWALLAVFYAMGGLLSFGIITAEKAASGEPVPWRHHLLLELDGSLTALLLLPFLLWFMHRHPIRRDNWWWQVPRHLGASLLYGVSHTLLMWGTREVLYRLLGWGDFDYGLMRYRFPMEYQKQLVMYWAIYVVVALLAASRHTQAERLRASELERRLTEARLDALKMQLNPHFLFNTLNMISSLIDDDPRLADTMIGHLSDFLRATLRHSRVHEVALDEELELLDSYLAIMRARFDDRLRVEVEVEAAARRAAVPHLLLQPLVENAVTHSTEDPSRPGRITIRAGVTAGRTRITVSDNGPGIDTGDDVLERGVGLSNTSARLGELYRGDASLELVSAASGGLEVVIDLPHRPLGDVR